MSSVRTITHLALNRLGDWIWLDVEADGFLYNMVRAVAGTLINVGRGYWPEAKVAEILQTEDRREAGPTAPSQGLFLMRVTYDG
jgi:tRNA pseudouridine38-40 synthase